jgi:hypothetical protein
MKTWRRGGWIVFQDKDSDLDFIEMTGLGASDAFAKVV